MRLLARGPLVFNLGTDRIIRDIEESADVNAETSSSMSKPKVDEDEDENDDDEDEINELKDNFIADTHPDDLADLPAGGETDDRRHRELDRRREMEASLDAEKQAEILRQRYATKNRSGRAMETLRWYQRDFCCLVLMIPASGL